MCFISFVVIVVTTEYIGGLQGCVVESYLSSP